jgi:TolA-binding protein
MKRLSQYLAGPLAACSLCASGLAQQPSPPPKAAGVDVILKDGRQISATGFRLDGSTLMVTSPTGNTTGEFGYPLNTVADVEFPQPAQLSSAADLLAQQKAADALARIDPIVAYYGPLRNVPGNWWLPAALIKSDSLALLKRDAELATLLGEIARLPANPAAAEAVRLRTAETLLRHGEPDKAEPAFDELIGSSTDNAVLARAWVGKGAALAARGDFDAALLAYLRVPVLYPQDRGELPGALLGAGRAFAGLENRDLASQTFQKIVSSYPSTSEATLAKAELGKMDASVSVSP